ncbi:hypothetical protein DFJ63DRAFT_58425 [Scheffersomyces coipomensis]|uniref:uncharacterized protein n=1 Tax=Scheffersomyces coipomensis TaxID=1788519 RepID=UPI00315E00A3
MSTPEQEGEPGFLEGDWDSIFDLVNESFINDDSANVNDANANPNPNSNPTHLVAHKIYDAEQEGEGNNIMTMDEFQVRVPEIIRNFRENRAKRRLEDTETAAIPPNIIQQIQQTQALKTMFGRNQQSDGNEFAGNIDPLHTQVALPYVNNFAFEGNSSVQTNIPNLINQNDNMYNAMANTFEHAFNEEDLEAFLRESNNVLQSNDYQQSSSNYFQEGPSTEFQQVTSNNYHPPTTSHGSDQTSSEGLYPQYTNFAYANQNKIPSHHKSDSATSTTASKSSYDKTKVVKGQMYLLPEGEVDKKEPAGSILISRSIIDNGQDSSEEILQSVYDEFAVHSQIINETFDFSVPRREAKKMDWTPSTIFKAFTNEKTPLKQMKQAADPTKPFHYWDYSPENCCFGKITMRQDRAWTRSSRNKNRRS